MQELLSLIDYHNVESTKTAISKLRNNEHIKTAITCGILSHAFIIAQEGKEEPLSYEERKRE